MLRTKSGNWFSLLMTGLTAISISSMTTGCRIGNYVEQADNPDPYSGYYLTEPQKFTYIVTTDATLQKSEDLALIPETISQFITNPVALLVQDLSTGKGALTSPAFLSQNQIPSLPTRVRSDYSIFYQGTSSPVTFWNDPNCITVLKLKEVGAITPQSGLIPPAGTTQSVSGRMNLTIQVLNLLSGDCTKTLQDIARCYEDETNCGEATDTQNKKIHLAIKNIFDPYIDSEALQVSDFPKLTHYGYEATYR